MESVLITMKTRQITPDGDEETELMTTGTCEMRDDTLQLSYEDTDATGFAGSTTTIQVANESLVTILRTGTANSNLTLETGRKHFCLYQTPYGAMTIGVQAKRLLCELEESSGSVEMEHIIDMNANFLSENTITIHWKRQEPQENTKGTK